MSLNDDQTEESIRAFNAALKHVFEFQEARDIQIVRKEGELLFLIKQEPRQPVKYYMNKSGMSARWFNEILKQLIASDLVTQEQCSKDSRRRLLR
jgi:DNA-binding MarR family transcriptional regulator